MTNIVKKVVITTKLLKNPYQTAVIVTKMFNIAPVKEKMFNNERC